MLEEFKKFVLRGNVIDLAVGVIVGGAFSKIATSLVNDLVMPPLGLLSGGVDFKQLFVSLSGEHFATLEAAEKAGAPVLRYGAFFQTVVDFLLVAGVIFIVVRQLNALMARAQKSTEAEVPAAPALPVLTADQSLLTEIRDLLKAKG